jgi:hypothetical protein
MDLQNISEETVAILPDVLSAIPEFNAGASFEDNLEELEPLNPENCPCIEGGATIQVLDMDTFDAALKMQTLSVSTYVSSLSDYVNSVKAVNPTDNYDSEAALFAPGSSPTTAIGDEPVYEPKAKLCIPVAVLNLASEHEPGGGWTRGALAQEECLCYRSSLYLSLHKKYYPLRPLSAICSPFVVLVRDSMANGHALLKNKPADLPVVSVISVAALRTPELTDDRTTFKNPGARTTTKSKIRVALRIAATRNHTKLVLGALGCGVFR